MLQRYKYLIGKVKSFYDFFYVLTIFNILLQIIIFVLLIYIKKTVVCCLLSIDFFLSLRFTLIDEL